MSDKLKDAARDGRLAILPEFLQEGREVWYWRECLCGEDCCMDMVTQACPMNRGELWYSDAARSCAHHHPVLEHTQIWSVQADFGRRGVEWIVNDLPSVADCRVRASFFESLEAAMAHKPGKVEYG